MQKIEYKQLPLHKWISLFIWYPVIMIEKTYECKEGDCYIKLVDKKIKGLIWDRGTIMIGKIPLGLLINLPFIIYLILKNV